MGRQVKLMVACGSGIATSTHVAAMVEEYMKERNIAISIMTCSVHDLPNRLTGCDIILSTAQVSFETGLPVFNGVPLLTGVGEEELLAKLAEEVIRISGTGY